MTRLRRTSLCFVALAIAATSLPAQIVIPKNSRAEWFLRVHRPDGSVQCQPGGVIPLDAAARDLANNSVRILAQEKRALPMAVTTQCGVPTGTANTFLVAVSDPSKLVLDPASPKGFQLWPDEERGAVVSIGDGLQGCDGKGRSLNASSWLLKGAGVNLQTMAILTEPARKGCAAPQHHVFWIAASGVPAARKAGFVERASRLPTACDNVPVASAAVPEQPAVVGTLVVPKASKAFAPGAPVKVTFFVSSFGAVDSLVTDPAPRDPRAGQDFVREMRGVQFVPAVRAGCAVPSQQIVTITAG